MQPIVLNSLLTNVVKLRGFGPYYATLLKKLCGDRYLDIIFHGPSSVIERVKISELENKFINKRVILTGTIKNIWAKNPKISIITVDINNEKLSIIYFNVNKNWLRNTYKKNQTICFSGELNKKGKIWQITHPDYVIENIKNTSIPNFDTTYPLNSFFNNKDNQEKRFWIELTKNHFIKTHYDLGLNKCLNKIDLLIS